MIGLTAGVLVAAINIAMVLFIRGARQGSPCNTGQAA